MDAKKERGEYFGNNEHENVNTTEQGVERQY